MVLTFVDASVLIEAFRGESPAARRALDILDDPSREFTASDFLRLEIIPKPQYERRQPELAFYQDFFNAVTQWAPPRSKLVDAALAVATRHGLAAMDALHVAAAEECGAGEFVTAELPTKPLFRVQSLRVRSIRPDVGP